MSKAGLLIAIPMLINSFRLHSFARLCYSFPPPINALLFLSSANQRPSIPLPHYSIPILFYAFLIRRISCPCASVAVHLDTAQFLCKSERFISFRFLRKSAQFLRFSTPLHASQLLGKSLLLCSVALRRKPCYCTTSSHVNAPFPEFRH